MADVRLAFRQWRQPREFRIRATAWPEDALTAFTALAVADEAKPHAPKSPPAEADRLDHAEPVAARAAAAENGSENAADGGLPGRSVADVATSIWRLRNKMASSPEGASRGVVRHLETAWDALAQAGVEIQDHLNDPFDPGLPLKVAAFQPTPGLRREQVIETIRPSVYLHDRVVQTAEVIVGTPEPS